MDAATRQARLHLPLTEKIALSKALLAQAMSALEAPIRQIAANAGLDGSVILEKVKSAGKLGYGFDAYKEVYCDMMTAGIIDPAKVTRSALENAASISAMVISPISKNRIHMRHKKPKKGFCF